VSQCNEPVHEFSLFLGSLDEFISMDALAQGQWMASTPIIVSGRSPILSNIRYPLASKYPGDQTASSPVLNMTSPTSISDFLSQSIGLTPQQIEPILELSHFENPSNEFDQEAASKRKCPLEECISWIIRLINENERVIESHKLVQLQGDLKAILSWAQKAECLSPLSGVRRRRCERGASFFHELDLVNNLLLAAPKVETKCDGSIRLSL